jgi:hypothetical protein
MSHELPSNITDFFDICEKDTSFLLEVTKLLKDKVRLIFDPSAKRNNVGQQPVPNKCKIIVEKGDECFKDYVLFELQKSRKGRQSAKKVVTDVFPSQKDQAR